MSPSSSVVASSTCVMTASLSKSIYKFHIRAAKGILRCGTRITSAVRPVNHKPTPFIFDEVDIAEKKKKLETGSTVDFRSNQTQALLVPFSVSIPPSSSGVYKPSLKLY
ncbi:hypothetical protein ACLB2K_047439 [Fragaria x ananassa]